MSVDRQHGKLLFICDECGDHIDTGETEWIDALKVMREAHWGRRARAVRIDNDTKQWVHLCQDCDANEAST